MELEHSRRTICNTCLSADRDLYMIKDTLLPADLQDIGLDKEHSKVCWECRAIIKKIEAFKQKALTAQQLLNNSFKNAKHTLSTLNIVNKDTYDVLISKNESQFEYVNEVIELKQETESDSNLAANDDPIVCIKKEAKYKRKRVKETEDLSTNNCEYSLNCIKNEVKVKRKREKETEDRTERDSDIYSDNYDGSLVCVKKERKVKKKRGKGIEDRIEGDGDRIDSYIVCSINEDELIHLRDKQKNSSIYRRAVFKCDTCILVFRSDDELKQHFNEIHSEVLGAFVCKICEQRLPNSDEQRKHTQYHYNIYKCTLCKHRNCNLNRMLQHMKRNHSKEYSCTLCDVTFNSKGAARYHIKTHNLEECKVCGRAYSDLKLHMTSHNKMRTEECHICHKSLKSKSSLRFHLLTHATPRKDEAYCAECDAQFKNKHIYRMHLKTNARHTTPDKECDYCHRKFISKFSLAKHISVVHYNKLDHICHLCGKKFSIAGHLRNHILIHHEGGSKPKKHVCDLCGKGFAIRKCLTDHMNSHTGARPYKCLSCPAQFGFKSALYMHNRLKHLKGKKGKKADHVCSKNVL